MKPDLVRLPASLPLAVAIAAACAAVAIAAVVSAPTPPPNDELSWFFDLGEVLLQATSAIVMILLAIWLRDRQDTMAYALLAGGAVVAGWATDAVWRNTVEARSPAFGLDLLAMASTVVAPTAILALFAITPRRRLSRWTPALLGVVVGGALIGVAMQTWIHMRGWTGDFLTMDNTGLLGDFAGWFTSPLPAFTAFVAAALGSLRNEALRFAPGSPLGQRRPAFEPALRLAVVLVLVVAGAATYAWALRPTGDDDLLLLPLLAALVGIVAARWSAFVAWTAITISVAIAAAAVFGDAVEIAVEQLIDDPDSPWTPTLDWLVLVGVGWVTFAVAILYAARALAAARSAIPGRPVRSTPDAFRVTVVALGVAALATVFWTGGLGSPQYPLLEIPVRLGVMEGFVMAWLVVIGAAEAVRGRLVPAVAEAEGAARRPFRPFRYLETVVVEALTERAALRRVAIASERTRLASDLHAELLPSLAEIAAEQEAGAPAGDVAQRLRRLEDDIRDLMAERRLVVLEEFGIVEAIEWLLGRAEERMTLDVELSIHDRTTPERPPREVERAAFRIAQLAVENALQHAAPTRLALDVLARSDEVRISISDDGRGFGEGPDDRSRDHLGIADMRSQAADVRGDVRVVAPAAGGTTVTFAWPAI